ncbi:MAG: 4-(cytidine 5'-diphospho)-2-C-methyl-D-erythritol kinase [Coriobacteriaceae bacterium]|nr:4-(cytidine 5'-diphospho)-2-C-methyl-D-erythritol kinase [Coriobacteriaceae bacterium]
MQRLTLDAPAKINLFLAVFPIVTNGRHSLSSIFSKLSLCDTLEFCLDEERGPGISLDIDYHEEIDPLSIPYEDNIICKTVHSFMELTGKPLGGHLHVRLTKRIPEQGGLGGGSSDAAATIRALAHFHGFAVQDATMLSLASRIGSDTPFFLYGDCALMSGNGEAHIQNLPQPHLDLVLVKPKAGVSTRAAYEEFDRNVQVADDVSPLITALLSEELDIPTIAANLHNNLYPAAKTILPELGQLVDNLSAQPGVIRALLTGSGATVFAVCEDATAANIIEKHFANRGYWAKACTTLRTTAEQASD